MSAQEIRSHAESLMEYADRLESGEELCYHHWSGDPAWECFCPGCGKHIQEAHSKGEIPFKEDAYCHKCSVAPEEKEAKRDKELKLLAELKQKYPDS